MNPHPNRGLAPEEAERAMVEGDDGWLRGRPGRLERVRQPLALLHIGGTPRARSETAMKDPEHRGRWDIAPEPNALLDLENAVADCTAIGLSGREIRWRVWRTLSTRRSLRPRYHREDQR